MTDTCRPITVSATTSGIIEYSCQCARVISLLVVTGTIAAVPWFLGGAIPHAVFFLQIGAVTASFFAIFATFLESERPSRLPATCLPLLAVALIGLIQLLPIHRHPATQMRNAVQSHLVPELATFQGSLMGDSDQVRSLMPSETRLRIGQAIAIALIAIVLLESARTTSNVVLVLSGLVLSGCLMTGLALSQRFGAVTTVVGNHWKVSATPPFGCFVNPNNAASWLIACLASALFLGGVVFQSTAQRSVRTSKHWRTIGDSLWLRWIGFVGRVGEINSVQLLAASAVILLLAGIGATLSRAGIVACSLGIVALIMSRTRSGNWLGALCSMIAILLLSCLFLTLMDIDTLILTELQTLKDPVSDTTGRLLHWNDSLRSVLDFPCVGSGLGAYRYASLPYQARYTGRWFQRADNQYVEVLVECGFAGLVCLSAFGLLMLALAYRVLVRRKSLPGGGTLTASWLGSAVVFESIALSGAAFFDYGISLPSVQVAVVAIVVMLERHSILPGESKAKPKVKKADVMSLTRFAYVAIWLSLITSTVLMIPDSLAAARVYSATAPVQRMIDRPDIKTLTESGDKLLSNLTQSLSLRPDDDQGNRTHILLMELLFRRDMVSRATAGRDITPAGRENAFRTLSTATLAERFLTAEPTDSLKLQIQTAAGETLSTYPWHLLARELLLKSACVPTIGARLSECERLVGSQAKVHHAVTQARFCEPHAAQDLYEMGFLMLHAGELTDCRKCWAQSVAASEQFRASIIRELSKVKGTEIALQWFSPDTYEACVRCALEMRSEVALRQHLFEKAEKFWRTSPPRVTEAVAVVRSMQLKTADTPESAIRYLDAFLLEHPGSLPPRRAKAQLLEEIGRNGDAYDEWLRIQSLFPSATDSELALDRLIKLPPTTGFR